MAKEESEVPDTPANAIALITLRLFISSLII